MVSLFEMAVLLLCTGVSGLHVLQAVIDHLLALSPCDPVVSATAGAVTLTPLALCIAYFTGITLVHLQILPAPPALVPSPVALRLFAAMACALLVVLLLLAIMPLLPWL